MRRATDNRDGQAESNRQNTDSPREIDKRYGLVKGNIHKRRKGREQQTDGRSLLIKEPPKASCSKAAAFSACLLSC